MSKVTWNDINSATFNELKNKYKLNNTQLEQQVRRHLDSASVDQMKVIYHKMCDKRS